MGKTACLCLGSVAENALVDFSLGKQRDRKSTTQKVEGREERRDGKRTSPGNFPTLSASGRQKDCEAEEEFNSREMRD